jgi:hypothetical protein
MLRLTGAAAILAALSGTVVMAAEAGQTCRTSHNLVGACFTVHGFLSSSPSGVRLAWAEAGRTLAVLDRQSARQSSEIIPDNVLALLGSNSSGSVEGDYVVCPFDRTHLDRTQAFCIEAASHLIARSRH